MAIVWGFVWGIMVLAVMLMTIQYYLPLLSKRVQASQVEALAVSDENNKTSETTLAKAQGYHSYFLKTRVRCSVLLVLCTCIGFWCGYTVSENAFSLLALLKLTLAMAVLSCIFITDLELFIIPNACALVLIIGRLVAAVFEFIFYKETALPWLLNSTVSFIVSVVALFIMNRVTHGGLGMGDVKLLSAIGFLCGAYGMCYTLVFAFFSCAIGGVGLLVAKQKTLKDALALGPFIWVGFVIASLLSVM